MLVKQKKKKKKKKKKNEDPHWPHKLKVSKDELQLKEKDCEVKGKKVKENIVTNFSLLY